MSLSVKVVSTAYSTIDIVIDATYTVTTTSGEVVAANKNRRYLLLANDSDQVIYLRFGVNAAIASQGIRLNANGGSYEMSADLGNLFTGAIKAIHAGTGNKVLLVTEGV